MKLNKHSDGEGKYNRYYAALEADAESQLNAPAAADDDDDGNIEPPGRSDTGMVYDEREDDEQC